MLRYHYSPLSSRADSIRLMRLMPHHKTESRTKIQCELFDYNLQDSGAGTHLYEALSYTWGDSNKPRSISIKGRMGGRKLAITENLYAALLRLRDHTFERILWIDAICINQKDSGERSQQIQLMAKIYSKATRVLVWLGESTDNSDDALEAIRIAGETESSESLKESSIKQGISELLKRQWFQRIWVLQEVAAARQILIMCGSTGIDGYAFYLGVNRFYEAHQDLQNSIRSINYLIRGAIFRPKRATSWSGSASLNMRPLGELIDMFHTHKATEPVDRVYALLGMSSDKPTTAGLLPNYELPWEKVFESLVKFLLHETIDVEIWGDKTKKALINSKGCALGHVLSVERGENHKVDIVFKNLPEHLGYGRERKACWTLPASVNDIRRGDIVCLLEGTLKPVIVRPCHESFAIIRIAAFPEDKPIEIGDIDWSEFLRSITSFQRDFLLIWNWENSTEELQCLECPDGCEVLAPSSLRDLEDQETDVGVSLTNATRIWNIAMVLHDLEEYKKSEERLRDVIEGYEAMFGQENLDSTTLRSAAGRSTTGRSLAGRSVAGRSATGSSHKVVVKFLVEIAKTEPDLRTAFAQVPLLWATKKGYEAVLKLILDRGKGDGDSINRERHLTLLLWAAENGCEDIVKLLLERGEVEADAEDEYYRTPLSWAAENGHESIVRLLLETGKVEPDSNDYYRQTPLSWAARKGHEAIVRLLLETGEVDPDSKDYRSQTPLSWAAEKGYESIVKLLLDTHRVEADSKDYRSQTPLALASKNGHITIVRLLLETGQVEVDSKDKNSRTPLSRAAENGREAVIRLLLYTGEAEIDWKDSTNRTPLSLAAEDGDKATVKLLLRTGQVELDSMDTNRRTPLWYAARSGNLDVVKLLLASNRVKADSKDTGDETPLLRAIWNGHEAVVKILLDTGEYDLTSEDSWKPMKWAEIRGHKNIIKLLRQYIE